MLLPVGVCSTPTFRPPVPLTLPLPYCHSEVSVDFFSYFTATSRLLELDPTLLCVSAFNDNGQGAYAGEPSALHRSDFFPGLGWLLTRQLWSELEPKWPEER